MKEETKERIRQDNPSNADAIISKYESDETMTLAAVDELHRQEDAMRKRHQEELRNLKLHWHTVWNACPHLETTYHPRS
jgi:hypothetical protein